MNGTRKRTRKMFIKLPRHKQAGHDILSRISPRLSQRLSGLLLLIFCVLLCGAGCREFWEILGVEDRKNTKNSADRTTHSNTNNINRASVAEIKSPCCDYDFGQAAEMAWNAPGADSDSLSVLVLLGPKRLAQMLVSQDNQDVVGKAKQSHILLAMRRSGLKKQRVEAFLELYRHHPDPDVIEEARTQLLKLQKHAPWKVTLFAMMKDEEPALLGFLGGIGDAKATWREGTDLSVRLPPKQDQDRQVNSSHENKDKVTQKDKGKRDRDKEFQEKDSQEKDGQEKDGQEKVGTKKKGKEGNEGNEGNENMNGKEDKEGKNDKKNSEKITTAISYKKPESKKELEYLLQDPKAAVLSIVLKRILGREEVFFAQPEMRLNVKILAQHAPDEPIRSLYPRLKSKLLWNRLTIALAEAGRIELARDFSVPPSLVRIYSTAKALFGINEALKEIADPPDWAEKKISEAVLRVSHLLAGFMTHDCIPEPKRRAQELNRVTELLKKRLGEFIDALSKTVRSRGGTDTEDVRRLFQNLRFISSLSEAAVLSMALEETPSCEDKEED